MISGVEVFLDFVLKCFPQCLRLGVQTMDHAQTLSLTIKKKPQDKITILYQLHLKLCTSWQTSA